MQAQTTPARWCCNNTATVQQHSTHLLLCSVRLLFGSPQQLVVVQLAAVQMGGTCRTYVCAVRTRYIHQRTQLGHASNVLMCGGWPSACVLGVLLHTTAALTHRMLGNLAVRPQLPEVCKCPCSCLSTHMLVSETAASSPPSARRGASASRNASNWLSTPTCSHTSLLLASPCAGWTVYVTAVVGSRGCPNAS